MQPTLQPPTGQTNEPSVVSTVTVPPQDPVRRGFSRKALICPEAATEDTQQTRSVQQTAMLAASLTKALINRLMAPANSATAVRRDQQGSYPRLGPGGGP